MADIETRPETVVNMEGEDVPGPTIYLEDLRFTFCPHCGIETTQVGPAPEGWPASQEEWQETLDIVEDEGMLGELPAVKGHCLQCMADGGSCCSLKPLTRWKK